jgi:hypothetical protein
VSRTVPSFRIALAMEKKEWKSFRNALDNKERKEFDEMWDIAISRFCLLISGIDSKLFQNSLIMI